METRGSKSASTTSFCSCLCLSPLIFSILAGRQKRAACFSNLGKGGRGEEAGYPPSCLYTVEFEGNHELLATISIVA